MLGLRACLITALAVVVHGIQIVNTSGVTTLTWVVHDDDDSLITFNATCKSADGTPVVWCGFGISPTGGMWPSGLLPG